MLDFSSVTSAGSDLLQLIEDDHLRRKIDQFLVLAEPHVEKALMALLHEIVDDVNSAVSEHYTVRLVHEDCAVFVEVLNAPAPSEESFWTNLTEERREIALAILSPEEDSNDD